MERCRTCSIAAKKIREKREWSIRYHRSIYCNCIGEPYRTLQDVTGTAPGGLWCVFIRFCFFSSQRWWLSGVGNLVIVWCVAFEVSSLVQSDHPARSCKINTQTTCGWLNRDPYIMWSLYHHWYFCVVTSCCVFGPCGWVWLLAVAEFSDGFTSMGVCTWRHMTQMIPKKSGRYVLGNAGNQDSAKA